MDLPWRGGGSQFKPYLEQKIDCCRLVIKLWDLPKTWQHSWKRVKESLPLIHREFLHCRVRRSRLEVSCLTKNDQTLEEMNSQSLIRFIPDSANSYHTAEFQVAHYIAGPWLDYQKRSVAVDVKNALFHWLYSRLCWDFYEYITVSELHLLQ